MFSITVLSPDMESHVTGCSDINRRGSRWFVGDRDPHVYEGADVLAAIKAADVDLAYWFGEKPYTPREEGGSAWTIASTHRAPCLAKVLRAAKVKFSEDGEPSA